MATKAKNKGGRPKQWEQHKGYEYRNKNGVLVKVKSHREKYSKHVNKN